MHLSCSISEEKLVVIHKGLCNTYNNRHARAPWTGYNGHVLGHHGRVHGAPLLALMSMVPRPQRKYIFFKSHSSSGHHGHFLDLKKIYFQGTSSMNACIVFQSDIILVHFYILVDNTLMCYKNI